MAARSILVYCSVLVVIYGVNGHTYCDDGWIAFQDNCYYFGHNDVHFTEAEHYCGQHGGHVVEVYSRMENEFLKDRMRQRKDPNKSCYWLGITDEVVEGTWQGYHSHAMVNFTDWEIGQPGHDGEQDCANFNGFYSDFEWHDGQCVFGCMTVCKQSGYKCEDTLAVVG